ncbi:MAG: cytochrome c oxidase subunit II [Bacteroidia bacterium]
MIKLLVEVVIILTIIAITQLVRVFELTSELKADRSNDVTEKDNRMNARLMLTFLPIFFIFCLYWFVKYKKYFLPVSASESGVLTDELFNFNMLIITIVFVITQFLLFWFAFKYYARKGTKAYYYPHNNKLEFAWTVIPALALSVIIIFGLRVWDKIMTPADDAHSVVIELYGQQFQWTARYAGKDNVLGRTNYRLTDDATNPLAMDSTDEKGWDDIIVRHEFHIPVNREISFKFRSRDVIHSAYMPHFRAQMNVVPGMETMFHFKPTITTDQMRKITNNPAFDYILLCNKVCGASHYNMQMNIVVDTEADYEKWLSQQKPFYAAKLAAFEQSKLNASTSIAKK